MIENAFRLSLTFCLLAAVTLSLTTRYVSAEERDAAAKPYSYATKGLVEFQRSAGPGMVESWKLLLDQSNLGGNELEVAELTLPAGLVVGAHHHGTLEIFYVLSGKLDHEVNGKMHTLTPGMVGVVRSEDSVRHIVPKDADVRLLVIWAPAGEAKKFFGHAKTTTIEQK